MPGNGAEIYKTCREAAGLTQEQASEGLNCSVRSLARYESGEQHVPDDIAYQMVVLYDTRRCRISSMTHFERRGAQWRRRCTCGPAVK